MAQPVRISRIDHIQSSQELMSHSLDLIGTPCKWGGSVTVTGFDCSGMIQYVYRNVLNVSLPRTTCDMAVTSRKIPNSKLKAGDLVFFNIGDAHTYPHVGLYIGNGGLIHAPSSGKTVKAEKPFTPFYTKDYLGVHAFFAE